VNILTYKDSWVKFMDCIEGMKELSDKSIDLCLTDPPYNMSFTSRFSSFHNKNCYFKDTFKNIWELNKQWFSQVMRICNGLIFTCGTNNFFDWIRYQKPDYEPKYWYKSNDCNFRHFEPFLLYGKHRNISKLRDVIDKPKSPGYKEFIHCTVKQFDVWRYILERLQPTSVLDPFMGSGTTLEACIQLGIPCYGFELMEEYRVDMEKRIERSKYYKKPRALDEFMK